MHSSSPLSPFRSGKLGHFPNFEKRKQLQTTNLTNSNTKTRPTRKEKYQTKSEPKEKKAYYRSCDLHSVSELRPSSPSRSPARNAGPRMKVTGKLGKARSEKSSGGDGQGRGHLEDHPGWQVVRITPMYKP